YSTDSQGRPSFRYRVRLKAETELAVLEKPAPLRAPAGVGVLRRFTLSVPAQHTAWMLAGETDSVPRVLNGKGDLVNGDRKDDSPLSLAHGLVLSQPGGRVVLLRLTGAPEKSTWRLRKSGSRWQVLVKLPASAEAAERQVGVEVWAPHRDDPGLLKELLTARG